MHSLFDRVHRTPLGSELEGRRQRIFACQQDMQACDVRFAGTATPSGSADAIKGRDEEAESGGTNVPVKGWWRSETMSRNRGRGGGMRGTGDPGRGVLATLAGGLQPARR